MIPAHIFKAVQDLAPRLPYQVQKVIIERAPDGYAVTLDLGAETKYVALNDAGELQLVAAETN